MSVTPLELSAGAICRRRPVLFARLSQARTSGASLRLLMVCVAALGVLAPMSSPADVLPCTGNGDCPSGAWLHLPFGCFCIPADAARLRVETFDAGTDVGAQILSGQAGVVQTHLASGGVDGGPHLQLTLSYEQSWSAAFTLTSPPFAPLDIGASRWLRVDLSTALVSGPAVRLQLLLQQDGVNYAGPVQLVSAATWTSSSFIAEASDFLRLDASPERVHPDFSAQGAPISIGFLVDVSSVSDISSTVLAMDNYTAYLVAPAAVDCNGNNIPDATDIANGTSQDCNGNGFPDECDIAGGYSSDLDANYVPDECDAGAVRWITDNNAANLWTDPANWSGGVVPGPTDRVTLDRANSNPIINFTSANTTVSALVARERLELASGTFGVTTGASLSNALLIRGGSLACYGPVNSAGYVQWTAGDLLGTSTFTNAGRWFLSAPNLYIANPQTANTGVTTQDGPTVLRFMDAELNNAAGAMYEFTGDGRMIREAGTNRFVNSGTIRKVGGTGTTAIDIPLQNTGGTLEVRSGTLKISNGNGSSGGVANVAGGAVLMLSPAGTPAYSGDWLMHVQDDGLITFGGGAPILSGTYIGSGGGRIEFNYLTVGPGGVTFNHSAGPLRWIGTNGLIDGGNFTNAGGLTLTGTNMLFTNGTLINSGTINHGSGKLSLTNATLNNLASGVYDFTTDGRISGQGGTNLVTNAGTIRKSAGTDAAAISVPLNNLGGTLEALSGTLSVEGPGNSTGGTMTAGPGATLRPSATPTVDPTFTGNWALNAGQGGVIDFVGGAPYCSGTFTGTGLGTVQFKDLHILPEGLTFSHEQGLTWSGWSGTISGGTFNNPGHLVMASPNLWLRDGTLVNSGTIVHDAGTLRLGSSTLHNLPTGVYDFIADAQLFHGAGAINYLDNEGLVRKSAGSGEAFLGVFFRNAGGTVEAQSGTLAIGRGGDSQGGTMIAAAGAVLKPSATLRPDALYTYSGNWTLTPAVGGLIDFCCATPTLTGNYTGTGGGAIWLTNFIVGPEGATWNCPPGMLHWTGFNAAMSGGTWTNADTLAIDGTNLSLTDGTIVNLGTITHGPGNLAFTNATINNPAGSVYDFVAGGRLSNVAGVNHVINAGTIRKSAGADSASANVAVDTTGGTLEVLAGALVLEGSGNSTGGTMSAAAGTLLRPSANGNPTYAGTWALNTDGDGIIDFSGGNPTLSGAFTGTGTGTVQLGNVTIGADALAFNCPPGMLNWVSGTMSTLGGSFSNVGNLNLAGNSLFLTGVTIQNAGTITHGGGVLLFSSATLNNLTGATYDLIGDGILFNDGTANPATNAGLFRKSGGVATSFVDVPFTNAGGTVEAHTGTLSFHLPYVQTSGDTLLTGGAIAGGQAFNLQGGRLSGAGEVTAAINNTGGSVEPGSPFGDLTVTGSYVQATGGTLSVEIRSLVTGASDRLVVIGSANLNGKLNISLSGTGVKGGDQFTILTANSLVGQFAEVTGPAANRFSVSYVGNTVVLTALPGAPMDFNSDDHVDHLDLDVFRSCLTGPAVPYDPNHLPAGCTLTPVNGIIAADFDGDGDVDNADYGAFQKCWSGTDPAKVNCGN